MDRSKELRRMAAECTARALTMSDPTTRVTLLEVAQKLLDLANAPSGDEKLHAILRDFNDQQMTRH